VGVVWCREIGVQQDIGIGLLLMDECANKQGISMLPSCQISFNVYTEALCDAMRFLIKYAMPLILSTFFFLKNTGELCFYVLRRKGGTITLTKHTKTSSVHFTRLHRSPMTKYRTT
jgi:hypothetical protein